MSLDSIELTTIQVNNNNSTKIIDDNDVMSELDEESRKITSTSDVSVDPTFRKKSSTKESSVQHEEELESRLFTAIAKSDMAEVQKCISLLPKFYLLVQVPVV